MKNVIFYVIISLTTLVLQAVAAFILFGVLLGCGGAGKGFCIAALVPTTVVVVAPFIGALIIYKKWKNLKNSVIFLLIILGIEILPIILKGNFHLIMSFLTLKS